MQSFSVLLAFVGVLNATAFVPVSRHSIRIERSVPNVRTENDIATTSLFAQVAVKEQSGTKEVDKVITKFEREWEGGRGEMQVNIINGQSH